MQLFSGHYSNNIKNSVFYYYFQCNSSNTCVRQAFLAHLMFYPVENRDFLETPSPELPAGKSFLRNPPWPWQHIRKGNRVVLQRSFNPVWPLRSLSSKLTSTQPKPPFQFERLHILTHMRHRRKILKEMTKKKKGEKKKNQSYQFLLKFKLPLVTPPSISCSFTRLHVGLVCGAHC